MSVVILPVFKSVVFAVLNVMVICSFGFFAVYKGLLTFANTRVVGRLTFMILLPCLLFDKLAQSLSIDALRELWIFPVLSLLNILIGYGIGFALERAFRVRREEARRVIQGTCAYINCANLPLILLKALSSTSPFLSGDPTAERRGQAYIFLYTIGWNLTFLSVGERVMYPPRFTDDRKNLQIAPAPAPAPAAPAPPSPAAAAAVQLVPVAPAVAWAAPAELPAAAGEPEEGEGDEAGPRRRRRRAEEEEAAAPFPPSLPESKGGEAGDEEAPAPRTALVPTPSTALSTPPAAARRRVTRRETVRLAAVRTWGALAVFTSPPFLATAAAFVVGLAPPLRGLLWGPGAPLADIYAAVAVVGAACIPVDTIVLAASLVRRAEGPGTGPGGPAPSYGRALTAAVVLAKLVAAPAVNVGLVAAAERAGLLPADPLAKLVLLMEQAMPSAQSVATFAVMRGSGEAPAVARLLLVQYCCCIGTITGALTLFQILAFPS